MYDFEKSDNQCLRFVFGKIWAKDHLGGCGSNPMREDEGLN